MLGPRVGPQWLCHSVNMTNDSQLRRLVGTWRGEGLGCYPTIADFGYTDEITFTDTGRPFLHFVQRTSIDGQPRHTETGYWRMPNPDAVEVVIALPSGQAERGSGTCRTGTRRGAARQAGGHTAATCHAQRQAGPPVRVVQGPLRPDPSQRKSGRSFRPDSRRQRQVRVSDMPECMHFGLIWINNEFFMPD